MDKNNFAVRLRKQQLETFIETIFWSKRPILGIVQTIVPNYFATFSNIRDGVCILVSALVLGLLFPSYLFPYVVEDTVVKSSVVQLSFMFSV